MDSSMENILDLRKGTLNQPSVDCELINGTEYKVYQPSKSALRAINVLQEFANKHKLTRKPLDTINKPYEPIVMDHVLNHTVLKPILAVKKKESVLYDWIVDFTDSDDAVSYCAKPQLYKAYGAQEYWLVNTDAQVIFIYRFGDDGFIPTVVNTPRRIKINIYESLYISYSDIFGS